MIRVGLIGFGKTGKSIASVLLQQEDINLRWVIKKNTLLNHRLVDEYLGLDGAKEAIIYSLDSHSFEEILNSKPVDVIIDFSSQKSIYAYGEEAARLGICIVSAISHYEEEEINFLKKLGKKTIVFWSPNITVGINYLIFAAKVLKKLMPELDVEITEEHFKLKEGISGTALKIASGMGNDEIKINSIRAGGIVGRHEIIFGFPYQTVRLVHESISREAFGNGALFVARNILGKPNGFYNFDNLLLPMIEEQIQIKN